MLSSKSLCVECREPCEEWGVRNSLHVSQVLESSSPQEEVSYFTPSPYLYTHRCMCVYMSVCVCAFNAVSKAKSERSPNCQDSTNTLLISLDHFFHLLSWHHVRCKSFVSAASRQKYILPWEELALNTAAISSHLINVIPANYGIQCQNFPPHPFTYNHGPSY